ncbi:gamma-glutamyltransferase [Pseudohalioglobus lutimaris]|uniref:Glutathione hydrolase proenzyme n=1 Tax=Pseudohalioglobus lutimaris TaxID=1737061 RepID=A0A2N5X468_9GAMM|nr:gamma-glutamyltransferase [Pseudohalioglobus lutimaris]PLW69291.1 gamma-glutamyltransferase [Pseudohalioglobus lutimaris]
MSAELGPGGRPVGETWSRSPVYGSRGMAATAHPLASQVALDILKEGGSAVDAAIAANAALGLMEPTGNGIGGDIFVIVWDPKTRQLHGYNGSGRSPQGQTLAQLQSRIDAMKTRGELPGDFRGIPSHGPLPVSVPGTVDGWFALHERFGSLPMNQVLAPAIDYARSGFPVSPVIAYYFSRSWDFFSRIYADSPHLDNIRDTWFKGGQSPQPGDILTNTDLADTLETIALEGRDAFYSGSLARQMAAYFDDMDGGLAYEDLAVHQGEWVAPGSVHYRGYDLYELPPNGQGFAALQMLSILKNVDLSQWSRGSAEVFHYMVEAKRLAFEDVARYYADPAFAPAPLAGLLSDDYGKQRFALIDPRRASAEFGPGEPKLESEGDTTYLTVADKDGMMVSLIQSNYRGMGSGMVPDGLGFMFQDRGELFSLEQGHANVYAPGKRPFQTIIPAFLMKDGEPVMSFGLMGGSMQPQGHVQILVNMLDFGMNVQEAGDAARFLHDGGREPTSVDGDPLGTLYLEPGVPAQTVERLRAMGHKVEIDASGVRFGGYQAIKVDREKGSYAGATEMRKDGTVVAW